MRSIILLFGFLFFYGSAHSQSVDFQMKQTMNTYQLNKLVEEGLNPMLTADDIDGSPYLNNEFTAGTVYMNQSEIYEGIDLRYNIYNDQMEFHFPGEEVKVLATPELLEKVKMGDTTLVYLPYRISRKIKKGFFIVLLEGKASLYAKPEVSFKKGTKPAAYQDAQPPKFERRPDQYFIRVGDSETQLVDNKKELLGAFPDNREEVEKFIKKNNIKIRKPESLQQLIRYYNSL